MKLSNYNVIKKVDKNYYLFNTLTRALAQINEEIAENIKINKIHKLPEDYYRLLIEEKFIISKNDNEIKSLEKYHHQKKDDYSTLSFVITPTLKCNFRCTYCFQEHINSNMNNDMTNKVVEFIKKQIDKHKNETKTISLCWYGGEPLINYKCINKISGEIISYCDKNKLNYVSNIITNGYLIDRVPKDFFVKNKITDAQITVDGPSFIHDQRRKLVNDGKTFDKIIENIKLLISQNININIRINIDRNNENYLSNLIEELKENKIQDVVFSLGYVKDFTDICKDVKLVKLHEKKFREQQKKFYHLLKKNKYYCKNILELPEKLINCGAVANNTFVIDSFGYIYKCWNDVGVPEKHLSSIEEFLIQKNDLYSDVNPFKITKCLKCKGLPICLGGCPYEYIYKNKLDCVDYENMIDNYIRFYINNVK